MGQMCAGNAVVGQAGGPTVVVNQSLVGVVQEVQKYDHIRHLFGAHHGVEGIVREDFVDLKRQPTEMLEMVARTPGAVLGSTRQRPDQQYCGRIFDVFRKYDVRYFFYIGGNDSAQTARIINNIAQDARYELRVIHIPKTIDNDLLVTDHCPGYGSAARFVAMAFMGDELDNRALPGIKVNVLMGRDAGFLTAASVLARQREDDGPHLIYLPERIFDLEKFVDDVCETYERVGRCLVAVSEGIQHAPESDEDQRRLARGEKLYWSARIRQTTEEDAFQNVQLSAGAGAMADFLAACLKENLKKRLGREAGKDLRIRADTFGYLQRSFAGCYSKVDAWEARLVGQMAVSYSLDADRDGSVVLKRLPGTRYAVGTELADLAAVAPDEPPNTKSFPDELITEGADNVKADFREYVAPLVGELPKIGWLEQIAQMRCPP